MSTIKYRLKKKYAKRNMLPISIHGIICGPSNCGKINKFAGKSTWHIFREYVRVLEVVIIKIPIFGEFITN